MDDAQQGSSKASWSAIRQDGELREFFRIVAKKHPVISVLGSLCSGWLTNSVAGVGGLDETETLRVNKKVNRLL